MEIKYISVAALNRYIQYKFDTDVNLQLLYIKAEISNVRLSKGILYFVLKDEESEIDALMYRTYLAKLNFEPIDGMTVLVSGKVSVYQKKGRYSLTVFTLEKTGIGDAYLEFLRLKETLAKEGLFDIDRKLPIPKMPEKIGIITSPTGDALHDVVTTINRRFPLAEIYLYPALVQGEEAPKSLISALNKCVTDKFVEVIIITRGGGTVEDLSCFNDEALARAIFSSPIPTVSGVGHEQDYTICDFVASQRAATPTAAAVIVTKDKQELLNFIASAEKQLSSAIKHKLITSYNEYQVLANSYGLKNFIQKINNLDSAFIQLKERLLLQSPLKLINDLNYTRLQLEERLNRSCNYNLEIETTKVEQLIDKLIILNPLNLMKKGYAITYQEQKLITSINNLAHNLPLKVIYNDGSVDTKIINIIKKEEKQ